MNPKPGISNSPNASASTSRPQSLHQGGQGSLARKYATSPQKLAFFHMQRLLDHLLQDVTNFDCTEKMDSILAISTHVRIKSLIQARQSMKLSQFVPPPHLAQLIAPTTQ